MAASTSMAPDHCYDVFLNHRGPDVKKTFASHLYRRLIPSGLRVFLDSQVLQEGEVLTCQIKGAIKTASVHVAIFSPRYAESQWCLDELVLMLESGAPIIPVFHGVQPAELRRTRGEGIYARSLNNLEMKRAYNSQPRYDSTTIEKWRNALSCVADISGLDLKAFNSDEGELVDSYDDARYASSDDDDEHASFSRYKMKHLQLLDIKIEEDHLKCFLEGVDSPKLLWFRWRNCPCSSLPPCIPMKKLRVLEVDGHRLQTLWEEELQAPLQLRVLRIDAPLSKIPKSIGLLKHLEQMQVLVTSSSITEIPNEFCDLRSLKHLRLAISSMSSRPDSFGNLSTLEHIDLSGCNELKRLPDSFGNLIKLKYLDLNCCSNLTLARETFGKISTLEYIDLTGCDAIEVLPSQIAHQPSLEKLNLELRNLKEFPSAIGESSGLEMGQKIFIRSLDSSFDKCLHHLQHIQLCRTKIVKVSFATGICPNLQHLQIQYCYDLVEVGTLSIALTNLELRDCFRLRKIEGLCGHAKLKTLIIQVCEIEELLTENLVSLEKAEVFECVKLKNIQGLAQMAQLRELNIFGCSELEELPGFEHLKLLEKLWADRCVKLKSIQGFAQLRCLRDLYVNGCSELEELSGLEHLRSLENLWLDGCVKLKGIQGLARLTQLQELYVDGELRINITGA